MSQGILSSITDPLLGKPGALDAAQQQTRDNRPNQTTPFGFSNWTQGPDGSWNQNLGFAPGMQGLFDTLQGQAGAGLAGGIGTGDDAFNQAFGASWANAQQNLLPQLQDHYDQGRSSLINSGAELGSEIYGTGMQGLDRNFNAGLTDAWQGAMQAGQGAQNLTYQQNKDAYAVPFSLMGQMNNWLQMPLFQGASGYAGAAGSDYQDQIANYSDLMGALKGGAGKIPFNFGAGTPPPVP